jgi:DNA-binding GntR family transcriptional regulator
MDDIAMKLPEPVSRHDGVALWRQIANRLQQDIGTGSYPPGGRLPTEAELSQHFRVNRHTVRRALEELSRGGLVRVEQGRGSFVAEDVLEYAVEARTRFSEWVRRHNKEPSGRVLQLKETAADQNVASALAARLCCWNGWVLPMIARFRWRSTSSLLFGCAAFWTHCAARTASPRR